ncbi:HD domain-containing protein [Vibrio sp.]|nr:HD domain-containing protein [Vibrio sp.]
MGTLRRKAQGNQRFWQGTLNQQLGEVFEQVKDELPQIERLSFALYDSDSDVLKTYADSAPNSNETFRHYECRLSELPSLLECAEKHQCRTISNFDSDIEPASKHNHWLKEQGFKSSYALPTFYDNNLIGFIFLNANTPNFFCEDVQQSLTPYIKLIKQAASWEYETIKTILDAANSTIKRQPRHMLQFKDHQERMYYYTKIIAHDIADTYKLSDEDIENITLFSRFHDIGKLSMSPSLLQKSTGLAEIEKDKVFQHIERGIDIIDGIISKTGCCSHASLNILKDIISYHQERLNGTGYPYGKKGDEIPVSARIISVANIFDALTSHRPYKQACSVLFALLELEKMVANGEVDKHCVNALRRHQAFLNEIISRYPETDPKNAETTH